MIKDEHWEKFRRWRGYKHLYEAKWDGYHTVLAALLGLVWINTLIGNLLLLLILVFNQ